MMVIEYNGYNIHGDGAFGMQIIRRQGPGSLPAALDGMFTTATFAKQAIDAYEAQKDKKKDAQSSSTD